MAFQDEAKYPIAQVSKANPSTRTLSPRTVHRWTERAVRGVKLEYITLGSRRYTSHEALARFLAATNAPQAASQQVPRSPSERNTASERAAEELEAAGA